MLKRIRRNFRNPLWRRRCGCALMLVGALLAAAAFRWGGTPLRVFSFLPIVVGAILEAKTSDGLLTVRYPGCARRSLTLAAAGFAAAAIGVVLRSTLFAGAGAALISGGVGFFLAGAGALAWHYAATYAGDRIVKLSDEDW